MNPACPECKHRSLKIVTERPLRVICLMCESTFFVDFKLEHYGKQNKVMDEYWDEVRESANLNH